MKLALLLVLVGCSSKSPSSSNVGSAVGSATGSAVAVPADAASDHPVPTTSLYGTFEKPAGAMAANAAQLAFTVENRGTTATKVDLDMLGSAIFAVEVFEASGKQRFTIPPGMPPANYQPRMATLAPGGKQRFEVTLNVFSPELAAGTYKARLRGYPSDEVTFQIR